jgi:hypothetical protein
LVGAAALAVVIFLLSQGSDGPRVTPLREEAPRQARERADAEPLTRFHPPVPVPGTGPGERRAERKPARDRDMSSRRRATTGGARVKPRKRTRRARSNRPLRPPAAQPAPSPRSNEPQPVSAPTPPSAPSPAAAPSPTQPPTIPTKAPPADPRPVEAAIQEIEIEDGELEDDVERVRSSDGHVRLRIRSDELVLVELEDSARTWLVPAHGEAVVEFDTSSLKGAKLELRHRKGLLVLRVRD